MKRKRAKIDGSKKYTSTELHPEVREMLGQMAAAWKRLGWKSRDYTQLLNESNVDVPTDTLRNWRRKVETDGTIFVEKKQSGNEKKLSGEEEMILVGHVLHSNDRHHPADGKSLVQTTVEFFDKTTSKTMHSRIMSAYGFSSKTVKLTKGGYQLDRAQLRNLYRIFRMELDMEGLKLLGRLRVASLDFTFGSHRTRKESTYALRGG